MLTNSTILQFMINRNPLKPQKQSNPLIRPTIMYTRNDITPEELAHIQELVADLCADLPQRCKRYRRRMIIFHNILAAIFLLLPLLTNSASAAPTATLANYPTSSAQTCEQVSSILKNTQSGHTDST